MCQRGASKTLSAPDSTPRLIHQDTLAIVEHEPFGTTVTFLPGEPTLPSTRQSISTAMSLEILPDLAVHKIVQSLACQGVFQLLALASISRQWRAAVKAVFLQELRLESISGFQQQRAASRGNALAAKFHILSTAKKTLFFISAARLLRQHQAVYCTGDAITDIVLLETAKGNSDTFCVEVQLVTPDTLTIFNAYHQGNHLFSACQSL